VEKKMGFRRHERPWLNEIDDDLYDDDGSGGYDYDAGMSNRALAAYEEGRKPLSKWTAAALRRGGWEHTLKLAKYLAKVGVWHSWEWHHSGGTYYNEVTFYDVAELVDRWNALSDDSRQRHIAECAAPKADDVERVTGSFALFETRWTRAGRPRTVEVGRREFTGTRRGAWIHLDGTNKRKRASGKHLSWRPA